MLKGTAFLAMWHDIKRDRMDGYMEWHSREHMPERLSIPGFTVGKRLYNADLAKYQIGTVYAGESLETFRSPDYLERLNNPTPWTGQVADSFENFLRMACESIARVGCGDGGAVATVRLDFGPEGSAERITEEAPALAETLLKTVGAVAVEIGLARDEVSSVRTRETELRAAMSEKGFDVVALIEGSSRGMLEARIGEIEAALTASGCLTAPESITYELAYQLTAEEMQG